MIGYKMASNHLKKVGILPSVVLTLVACASPVFGQSVVNRGVPNLPADAENDLSGRRTSADKHVSEAANVARQLLNEPRMDVLLKSAKGVFIVPAYSRAGFGLGAGGGVGLLVNKLTSISWSAPVFYNIGGMSLGLQAGVERGPTVLVLNNEKSFSKFTQKNSFSIGADAGLTIVSWSKNAQELTGSGDIVIWREPKGIYGNLASISVNDIRFNENLTDAYYYQNVYLSEIMAGRVTNVQADPLKQALAGSMIEESSGTSLSGSEKSGKPPKNP
jgi:lipid-binding SYLF domain-containing protein